MTVDSVNMHDTVHGRYRLVRPTIGGRTVRIILASIMLGVVVTRFGIMDESPGLLSAMDVVVVAVSLLFTAGVVLPGAGRTFRERLLEEKWLFSFTTLFTAGLLLLAFRVLTGDPAADLESAVRLCLVYSFLCTMRVLLGTFGSWAIDHLSPVAILTLTFALVIIVGAVLLMLPAATPEDRPIDPLDALFTSASATCVTGLAVISTGIDFSFFGQVVILMLIQIGGLGLMTFVAFFALFLGHSAGLKESISMSRVMGSDFVSDLKKLLASMIGWTLAIEGAGAFILYLIWNTQGTGWTTGMMLWQSIFHSVSAFCNAGFSLDPSVVGGTAPAASNLEGFAHVPGIPITIGMLIILGGLGFLVLTSVSASILHRLRTGSRKRLSLQNRLVLTMTSILIVLGFAAFLALEWDNSLAGMSLPQKISNAFLGAVTPRTAGFNTVPTSGLMPAVQWAFIALMFVGASPGGTGGGIKTSTLGLLIVGFVSLMRKRSSMELWKRRIPSQDLKRAAAVLLFGLFVFVLSTGVLLATETGRGRNGTWSSFDYMFEAMSAFGTVGLSTGVTADLTPAGKVAIICTMYLGRIGPATLAAISAGALARRYRYPEAKITIG
jgi:trk system potassium uptake protein TrkH